MMTASHASGSGPRIVALGGGHGLSASLRALRRITDRLTAIVGVADDGGSSGRLRAELGVVPPGDLRMALSALCADDQWGELWSRVIQHRFSGSGELAGHSVGNLLISALWQETGDVIRGLDLVGELLQSRGRVLPTCTEPLDIVAEIRGHDPEFPDRVETVRGQSVIASTPGSVRSIRLEPVDPTPCPEALESILSADAVVLGPGSWYTSVMPHLLIPELVQCLESTAAQRILVLNLDAPFGETAGFAPHTHLEVMRGIAPNLRLDTVVADVHSVSDVAALEASCALSGAELFLDSVASAALGRHDIDLLASAFGTVISQGSAANPVVARGRIAPWQ